MLDSPSRPKVDDADAKPPAVRALEIGEGRLDFALAGLCARFQAGEGWSDEEASEE
jgi:hypothetical protein